MQWPVSHCYCMHCNRQNSSSKTVLFLIKISLESLSWTTTFNKMLTVHIFHWPSSPKHSTCGYDNGMVLLFWYISSSDRFNNLTWCYCWAQKIISMCKWTLHVYSKRTFLLSRKHIHLLLHRSLLGQLRLMNIQYINDITLCHSMITDLSLQ